MSRPPENSPPGPKQASSGRSASDATALGKRPRAELSAAAGHSVREATSARAEDGTSVLTDGDLELAAAAQPSVRPSGAFDARRLWLGRTFGSFRIVRHLASGGMASVFLARKDGPGRISQHAAIKIVHPHLAGQSGFVDMFLDEARIISSVHHPNVCRVLDFGTEAGTYYLAMEYVLGETWSALQSALAAHDAGRAALPALSAYVIAQAAAGLHAAHEATDDEGRALHIVHRDVSPQNIFVAYDGSVRVLDFGIARAADRITTTQAGTVKGRLAYMAPEQMEGQPLDPRADIWSLGVVLREALECKRLFRRASDAETMFAVTSEPLPEFQGHVSPMLKEIVGRCLTRDLSERYRSANLLSADLTRFCRSQAMPMGMSEVSAWMHRLFAEAFEEKRRMLQEAAPEPVPEAAGAAPFQAQSTAFSLTPSHSQSQAAAEEEEEEDPSAAFSAELTHDKNLRLARVLFALLVAGGAGAGVYFARNQGDERPLVVTPLAEPEAPAQVAAQAFPEPEPTPPQVAEPQASDDREGLASSDDKAPRKRRKERGAAQEAASAAQDEAASQASEASSGTVLVAFNGGWAEVWWKGKILGTTPGSFSLPAGKHTLSFKPFGTGKLESRSVEVVAGGTAKLVFTPSELDTP